LKLRLLLGFSLVLAQLCVVPSPSAQRRGKSLSEQKAAAEKAWPLFFKSFRAALGRRDRDELKKWWLATFSFPAVVAMTTTTATRATMPLNSWTIRRCTAGRHSTGRLPTERSPARRIPPLTVKSILVASHRRGAVIPQTWTPHHHGSPTLSFATGTGIALHLANAVINEVSESVVSCFVLGS